MIVYRCLNKTNGKSYIGATTRSLHSRKLEHLSESRNYGEQDLYKAIREYGEDSFEWSVLEDCSSLDELAKKEVYYIEKFDSFKNGYNMNLGGMGGSYGLKGEKNVNALITDAQALNVYNLLVDGKSIRDVERITNISIRTISNINRGISFKHLYDVPPCKINLNTRETMSDETAMEVISLLNSGISINSVAKKMKLNKEKVRRIFYGHTWTHLYDIPPCEVVNKKRNDKKITTEKAKEIIDLIHSTDLSMREISEILGVNKNAVVNIAHGKSFKALYDKPPKDTRKERGNKN